MDIKIFKPKVEQILRASDLETVSAKRVRKQLMEDVGLDLRAYKSELDDLIKACFQTFLDGAAQEEEEEDVKPVIKREGSPPAPISERPKIKKEVKTEPTSDTEDADVRYARELQAQYDSPRASRSAGVKPTTKRKRTVKKKATEQVINSDGELVEVEQKKKKRAVTNNAFNKLLTLSDELAKLLGTPYLSRPQVSKQIWAYIKAPERNLQDQNDKRYINCDEKLQSLLGVPRVHMFSMTKILQKHMRDDGTAPIGYGAGEDVKTEVPDLVDSDDGDVKPKIKKQEAGSSDES
ncbi:SWIB/MDM2 domain protein [Taphrina deformans PYCC 5710]|uniref:SWIB/MDM2 domain protein n=1 Tax=Taphrina deformans (strain PYCC 5710 / ATCC 11124 / CBS 356.35 / IMI 108563 / JCM 9778 / NBRC 8474) TaxID=1097556 RepID=R4X6N2_TAPDE|nr:SWIB/MDM2 domain protein [Taphrina deformans PYCC 5710]|eukprot:CCG80837.1 SWIB/MDM2 domain protein [Taphrina deformans PYCC 5710]